MVIKLGWKINPKIKDTKCPFFKECPCDRYLFHNDCMRGFYIRNNIDEELFRIKKLKRKMGHLNN